MSVGQCWAIQQFGKSADLESCFPCFEMEVSLASSSLILNSVGPFPVIDLGRFWMVFVEY